MEEHLEFGCSFVLVPAFSLVGMASSAVIARVAAHRSMLPHLINRCILLLALLDLHFLGLALFNSVAATAAWPGEPSGLVSMTTRHLALPTLARASLLVVAAISAERFCAVRRPRQLQAHGGGAGSRRRRRFVCASLALAAAPLLIYGCLELRCLLPTAGNETASASSSEEVVVVAFAAADAVARGVPLLTILLLNAGTVRLLRRSFRQRELLLAGLLGIQRALLLRPSSRPPVVKRHRRTTCMLLYMSSLHLLLLTPAIFLGAAARLLARSDLRSVALTLEVAACCINFPLYVGQSEKFRSALASVCGYAVRRRRSPPSGLPFGPLTTLRR